MTGTIPRVAGASSRLMGWLSRWSHNNGGGGGGACTSNKSNGEIETRANVEAELTEIHKALPHIRDKAVGQVVILIDSLPALRRIQGHVQNDLTPNVIQELTVTNAQSNLVMDTCALPDT